jgi:hypothetical protein
MHNGRQRRLVRVVALVVLLGAILPNVTFIGHWSIRGLGDTAAHASAGGHANHCHGSSSCADQVGYDLQWWKETEAAVTLDSDQERTQAPERDSSPIEPVIIPPDPPPQFA